MAPRGEDCRERDCPLLDLPPELRLQIYQHLLGDYALPVKPLIKVWHNGTYVQSVRYDMNHPDKASIPEPLFALMATCRLLNTEVSPLLYEQVYFGLVAGQYRVLDHSLAMPEKNAAAVFKHVQHLDITTHVYQRTKIGPAIEWLRTCASWLANNRLRTLSVLVRLHDHACVGIERNCVTCFGVTGVQEAVDGVQTLFRKEVLEKASLGQFQRMLQVVEVSARPHQALVDESNTQYPQQSPLPFNTRESVIFSPDYNELSRNGS